MMSQLIPVNLPVRLQCFRVPGKWVREEFEAEDKTHTHTYFSATLEEGKLTSYDPWAMRGEFFRIERGNNTQLLTFLDSIGAWDSIDLKEPLQETWDEDVSPIEFKVDGSIFAVSPQPDRLDLDFWEFRHRVQRFLVSKKEVWPHSSPDLRTRFAITRQGPALVISTFTFVEALLASVMIDKALGAKTLKCARPDCGVLFTASNRHKRRYCSWYCGHIEAVRRQRATSGKQRTSELVVPRKNNKSERVR